MNLSKSHPLFGRLIQSGRDYLLQNGFKESDVLPLSRTLEVVWPNKKVMDKFAALHDDHATPIARVRPYPGHVTDCLDDKRKLADLLQQNLEHRGIAPTLVTCNPNDNTTMMLSPSPTGRYFVKHRWGVQGKSVYCFTLAQLVEWWDQNTSHEDFVIQHEVAPALWENRKFFLRAHILLTSTRVDDGTHPEHRAYLHRHVICQHHAVDYSDKDKLSHTSHSGSRLKRHPPPSLTVELDPQHPAADCWRDVERVCQILVKKFGGKLDNQSLQSEMDGSGVCFALCGVDLLMREDGKVLMCEVNTHPALGWGTMANVSPKVYSDIVRDTLDILLHLGDAPRFVRYCKNDT